MLRAAAPNILMSFIIIGIIILFKPNFIGLLGIISIVILVQQLKNKSKLKTIIYSLIHSWFYITIIYGMYHVLGGYGLIGYTVSILILALWRMYANRIILMDGMRRIETMLFGKPLDKENWKDGEKPKIPKLKRRSE